MDVSSAQPAVPMVEGDQRAGPGPSFALVEWKLRPPSSRPGMVARGSLVERLLGSPVPVVCVVAPPGYGKTTAELRLVPLMSTHLSFRDIGERLYVSQHTVKTQAISIYRKLGASSRRQAVQLLQQIGLLGA